MKRRVIRLTEQQLNNIIKQAINETMEEGKFKNAMVGAAIAGASLFPNHGYAQKTYNYKTPDRIKYAQSTNKADSLLADKVCQEYDYVTNHPKTEKELIKMFPNAYRDRNADSKTWKQNPSQYSTIEGRRGLTAGQMAAAQGENPWQAILNTYTERNYNSKIQKEKEYQDFLKNYCSDDDTIK